MKKCFLYLAGLLVLLAYSCTDEQLVEQTGNKLRITGSVASDSRTTFVEGEGVIETHWNVDDEIGLYTDKQSNLLYRATNDGKSTDFRQINETGLLKEEGKTVYAYYPYYNYPTGDIVRLNGNSATFAPEYHQQDLPNNPRTFCIARRK